MATAKKRVYISLPKELEEALTLLAKRDNVPVGTKATELITEAISIIEDEIWNELAEERERNATKYYSHEDAWKI